MKGSEMKKCCMLLTLVLLVTLSGCNKFNGNKSVKIEPKSPLIDGLYADPSVVVHDGYFYIYATIDPWGGNELALLKSADLKSFERLSLNWPTKEQCTSPTSNEHTVWAPSVIKGKNGKYYMYVSVGSEVWVGQANHPEGPWHNPLENKPLIPGNFREGVHEIDAEVFIDDDGQAYLYWGSGWNWVNGHCLVTKLNKDMIKFEGEVKEVTPEGYFEAPFMVKNNGKYYLMYSDGKCINDTYKVRYAIGDSPMGPFTQASNSPILQSDPEHGVYGPGHHAVLNYNNKWYIFYHRHALPYNPEELTRQICVGEMKFDTNGLIEKIKF